MPLIFSIYVTLFLWYINIIVSLQEYDRRHCRLMPYCHSIQFKKNVIEGIAVSLAPRICTVPYGVGDLIVANSKSGKILEIHIL